MTQCTANCGASSRAAYGMQAVRSISNIPARHTKLYLRHVVRYPEATKKLRSSYSSRPCTRAYDTTNTSNSQCQFGLGVFPRTFAEPFSKHLLQAGDQPAHDGNVIGNLDVLKPSTTPLTLHSHSNRLPRLPSSTARALAAAQQRHCRDSSAAAMDRNPRFHARAFHPASLSMTSRCADRSALDAT